MIRLILRLFGIRDFEPSETVAILKEQLAFERSEKQRLTETLLSILQPKVIESPPIELNAIQQTGKLFSHKRAILEKLDREEARIKKMSPNIGRPDIEATKNINDLEAELGIEQEIEKNG